MHSWKVTCINPKIRRIVSVWIQGLVGFEGVCSFLYGSKVPRSIAMEDSLSFRLDPFNLGAPSLWFREICNMKDVTPSKLQKLNRNPDVWEGNEIPQSLFEDI